MQSTAVTLSSILADITSMITSAVTWVTTMVNTITGSPLLFIFVCVSFVGLGVGLIRRIIRL